jgi:dihydrofolate reductase
MGTVHTQLAMSLDGFIADPDDGIDELFGFYFGGDTPVHTSEGTPPMMMNAPSAKLFTEAVARVGAFVVGRRLYDITNGWNGRPPNPDATMVVLTHEPPADWPRGGVPYHFVDSIDEAIATAQHAAGDLDVSVVGGQTVRACMDAGLLDEITVSLVPVILGEGIPWFAGAKGPVRLSDPEVTEDKGVTHLRYLVKK